MKRVVAWLALLAGGAALSAEPGRLEGDGPAIGGTASVMMLPLLEQQVTQVPTHPGMAVLLQFPEPITDYAGRGFTEDPAGIAGEFFLRWVAGDTYLVVTPLTVGVRATLHVILGGRSYPVHFFPADVRQAWAKVIFDAAVRRREVGEGAVAASPTQAPTVVRRFQPPASKAMPAPTPERLLGVLDTVQLLRRLTMEQGWALIAANPSLSLSRKRSVQTQGNYAVVVEFVLRNQALDALGFSATLENRSDRELRFNPGSLVVRAGDHVYAVAAADFDPNVPKGKSVPITFAIVNDGNAQPNFLSPDNDFRISLVEAGPARPSERTLP